MRAAPAKFLFDTDFGAPSRPIERGVSTAEVSQRASEAEAQGYQRGLIAGRQEAEAETARRAMAALEAVAGSLSRIETEMASVTARIETEAVDVALAAARKLCGELMAAEPMAETTALLSDCFRHLVAVPHLVVRINDALYDGACAPIEQLAAHSGFAGRLIILADPEMVAGDCKIEWADGGIERTQATTDAKISELVSRYLASRRDGAAQTATPQQGHPS